MKFLCGIHAIVCLGLLSPAIAGEDTSSNGSAALELPSLWMQFGLHVSVPYPINMQQVKRTAFFKWEHPPKLHVDGPEAILVDAIPLIDGAIYDLSAHYENAPELSDNRDIADIRMVFFDSAKTDMMPLLKGIVDSSLSDYRSFDEMVALAEVDATNLTYSDCSVHLFDWETDRTKPDPFAVILIDYSHPDYLVGRLKKQCLYEEIGHATTFFADITAHLTVFGTHYEFDTIYIASPDVRSHHDVFTSDDLALLEMLNNPKLKNGMPTHEVMDVALGVLGLSKEEWR
ncbi:hypothetical protein [Ruegeria atlantica]|uniref:hypothetical protein n=1 Tax=Ruegeria atlantica TaxID=81569 RepID=UPI00147A32D3|nr:hypothetical protein [Ruegeria atlantica]